MRRRPQAMKRIWLPVVLAVLACSGMGGCGLVGGSKGKLTISSLVHPQTRLAGQFEHGIYGCHDDDSLIIILYDGPADRPTQAATIRMFWRPRVGRTPIASTATNATIQYLLFARADGPEPAEEVGVYSGAGYLFPQTTPGQPVFRASLWQAALRLSDCSPGFEDLLGPSRLQGDLTVRRDDTAVREMLDRLNTLTSQQLGYPRLVQKENGELPIGDL